VGGLDQTCVIAPNDHEAKNKNGSDSWHFIHPNILSVSNEMEATYKRNASRKQA
jgi:hypothetical protein